MSAHNVHTCPTCKQFRDQNRMEFPDAVARRTERAFRREAKRGAWRDRLTARDETGYLEPAL